MLDLSEFDGNERDEPWHIDAKDTDPRPELARQMAVMREGHIHCPSVVFVAIPNAGKSTDWERIQRWKEGARAGSLDLDVTWPGGGVAFIEMKNGTEPPTRAQRDRLNLLYRQGHKCGVFRREDSVMAHLRAWGAPFLTGSPA